MATDFKIQKILDQIPVTNTFLSGKTVFSVINKL